ncbi:MAG: hypothetical protein E6Q97_12805 [Desulfurellales bacterium]|nr:MAG: hypothetical protein E6Q97_12805 [Desulfurellales bacterium]
MSGGWRLPPLELIDPPDIAATLGSLGYPTLHDWALDNGFTVDEDLYFDENGDDYSHDRLEVHFVLVCSLDGTLPGKSFISHLVHSAR